ncbi:hypothetical protein QUB37_03840 [Microcoleus sp. AT3-A2]|uniref:hypothetical protein n=1 Tax=Microcoleus sp. AT3-A2 TaxID=2818610 RepID=UPI002FD2B400
MNIHEAYNTLIDESATLDELLAAHKTFASERGYLLSVAMREPRNDMQIEPKLWKLLSAEAAVEFKIKNLFNQF